MADNPAAEVVDTDGQVSDHPRPYVFDRAILSAATSVNPSHRVIAAARPLLSIRHGIGFNETMRGP
ncbi:MAG TPA: GMC oxidoreductase [Streptosporangiaceae bacterium]|nr:GMC oxidoreductase [Streptosporangiaceae bacterium]